MPGHNAAPVIIKRKRTKSGGDGHHGGAWKVAYADFVTAMMAFFMLMWLIGATTEEQRKGIADYFSISIPLNPISGGGESTFAGDSVFAADILPQNGHGAAVDLAEKSNTARGSRSQEGEAPGADPNSVSAALQSIERILSGSGGESLVSDILLHHVVTRQTDEGLVIELHDLPGAPLFLGDGAAPTDLLEQLVQELSPVLDIVTNKIAIGGHVASRPVVARGIDPWRTSSERGQTTRKLLEQAGTAPDRIARVTGHGDRDPVTINGMAARNSRVEVILLRTNR
jgi:chemotaxis protein MotB